MKQKNWVDKSAGNSYQDNTTLNKKILTKMLFKMLKGHFSHKKIVRFLKYFFLPLKRGL